MSLAQVVYKISTDSEFAAQVQVDPDSALADKGFELSKEERAFLVRGLNRSVKFDGSKVSMGELAAMYVGWR